MRFVRLRSPCQETVARSIALRAFLNRISALAGQETNDDSADAIKKLTQNTSESFAVPERLESPLIVYSFVPLLKVEHANSDRIV